MPPSSCSQCQKPAVYMCSLCGTLSEARYCSEECQRQDWPAHSRVCLGQTQIEEAEIQDRKRDLRFYIQQLAVILRPIFLTLLLSIFWVKITNPPLEYYNIDIPQAFTPSLSSSFGGTTAGNNLNALWIALAIIGQIVIATFLFACAFYFNKAYVATLI